MSFLSFFKYCVFIYNFILMLFGASILGFSIYFYIDTLKYIEYSAFSWPIYSTVFIILIGIGLLSFIVGFFGCCGACKESSCMLCLYLTICLAICALAGSLIYFAEQYHISSNQIKIEIQKGIEPIIQRSYSRYNETSVANIVIDKIQEKLQCCGSNNFTDWANSSQNNVSRYDVGINGNGASSYITAKNDLIKNTPSRSERQISLFGGGSSGDYQNDLPRIVTASFRVPASCCSTSNDNSYSQCKSIISRYDSNPSDSVLRIPGVNQVGCVDKIYEYLFRDNRWKLNIIGGLALGLGGLSIIFACCLWCAITRAIDDDDDYDDNKETLNQ